MRPRLKWLGVAVMAIALIGVDVSARQAKPAQLPKSVRLYVFDCGVINVNRAGTERYKVTPEEVGETRFAVPCFLVAHPKGTLMWDLGILPDETVEARARRAGESDRDVRGSDDGFAYAREPVGGPRVSSGGHHLLCVLARAH